MDLPSTPERDQTAEHEHSRLCCLDMTSTDEHCNNHSHNGTPTWSGTPVSQPMFQPSVGFNEGHRHPPAPMPGHPPHGDDPFRVDPAAKRCHFISLNDDDEMSHIWMPTDRNT